MVMISAVPLPAALGMPGAGRGGVP
jgi:hypothetical protein